MVSGWWLVVGDYVVGEWWLVGWWVIIVVGG